jgi:alanyl-tRNA synthetase
MDSQIIRQKFFDYFKKKGHQIVPSSPLLPYNDPSLLFTNAGMNQFKDIFLGDGQRNYKKAATSQKCIRAGGKHNDLENVGHTKRHLTFFEMLGNFSFGDYFKKEAIDFSWELSTEIFGFDPNRIWPSVFEEDDEAFELWKKHVPEKRIVRFGESENFWSMGETGPCGPCSELLYDRGPKYGNGTSPYDDPTEERYPEFWNLVFMQYNKSEDGSVTNLPKPCIDTGAGLERIVSFINDIDNVFETDVLRGIIAQIENTSKKKYNPNDPNTAPAFRVISDHLRSLSFAIADGIQPSNLDRGYVLRKILRRAVRYGKQLGFNGPFLTKIYPALVDLMGPHYPELINSRLKIEEIMTLEEENFFRTLQRGGNILQKVIQVAKKEERCIKGEEAFKLKDTYGFPLEEISLIAKDNHLKIDLESFSSFEKQAKELSKKAHQSSKQVAGQNIFEQYLDDNSPCEFVGYQTLDESSTITKIYQDSSCLEKIEKGEKGIFVLTKTPFYSEMGGQVGDQGTISTKNATFQVEDCQVPFPGVIIHSGTVTKGSFSLGEEIQVSVNDKRRERIANNHTATHLLHWALQEVLGSHIQQGGSVVEPQRLRFDFSHHKSISEEDLQKIEKLVNGKIRDNIKVDNYELSFEEVQKNPSIKQFFGDKYGDVVRVIDMEFSKELCGGTHAKHTGSIGLFKIIKEGSISAGTRRIEAITAIESEEMVLDLQNTLETVAQALKAQPAKVLEKLEKLIEDKRALETFKKQAEGQQRQQQIQNICKEKETVGNIEFVSYQESSLSPKDLGLLTQEISSNMERGVVALAIPQGSSKCLLAVGVSKQLVDEGLNAKKLIESVASIIGGGGGGKPQLAQAGGKSPSSLSKAFEKIKETLLSSC